MADQNPVPPPPPPPLPPQKYTNRATNAIVRFAQPFIYGSRPLPSQTGRVDGLKAGNRSSYDRNSSPPSSQMTTHRTGLAIEALDMSPQRTHAVLAGREILKTIRVSPSVSGGPKCAEEFNLRSAIIAYASTHNLGSNSLNVRNKEQLAAKDVKWSHGRYESIIATASSNGHIMVYDLNRPGVAQAHFHEHNRPVHKIGFNPHEGAFLLSASQDGTVKFWDLRDSSGDRGVTTCRSRNTYTGNSDGIRNVKWSPTDGVEFAFCTDSGSVQKWDLRKNQTPLLRVNAHEKPCLTIDWHPDGKHLVSAGSDKRVKVWNFSSSDRRMKSTWDLQTPQNVTNLQWRPLSLAESPAGVQSWQSTYLATSYDHRDPRVHVWDLKRPHIPLYEFDRYAHSPTDFLWRSEDLLWTVGSEGIFTQIDMNFSTRVLDRTSFCSLDWGVDGELVFFTQKRPKRKPVLDNGRASAAAAESFEGHVRFQSGSERASGGHNSFNEEGIDENMLSSSWQKRLGSKSSSAKSSKSVSGTPPCTVQPAMSLPEAMTKTDYLKPEQIGARCYVPGAEFDLETFKYLATKYEYPPRVPDPDTLPGVLYDLCLRNAESAQVVGMYRLAQTWKIVGLALRDELTARIDMKREQEKQQAEAIAKAEAEAEAEAEERQLTHVRSVQSMVLQSERELVTLEPGYASTGSIHEDSSTATPLVRPASTDQLAQRLFGSQHDGDKSAPALMLAPGVSGLTGQEMSDNQDVSVEHVIHGLSVNEEPSLLDRPLSKRSVSTPITTWGPSDTQSLPLTTAPTVPTIPTVPEPVAHGFKMPLRAPLNYNLPALQTNNSHNGEINNTNDGILRSDVGVQRHDSNESFQMFSVSAGSSRRENSLPTPLIGSQDSAALAVWEEEDENEEEERRSGPHVPQSPIPDSTAMLPAIEPNPIEESAASKVEHDANKERLTPIASTVTTLRARISEGETPSPIHLVQPPARFVNADGKLPGSVRPNSMSASSSLSLSAAHRPSRRTAAIAAQKQVPRTTKPRFLDLSSTNLRYSPLNATEILPALIMFYPTKLHQYQFSAQLLLYLQSNLNHNDMLLPHSTTEAILAAYHAQLLPLLPLSAVSFRKALAPSYSSVYGFATSDVVLRPYCQVCRKPFESAAASTTLGGLVICDRCSGTQATCPICWSLRPPMVTLKSRRGLQAESQSPRVLWSWCPSCGHGGHLCCLEYFFGSGLSDGGCPTQGCFHDCCSGTRRELRNRNRNRRGRKRAGVRRDYWEVVESRAVEKARGLLVNGASAGARTKQKTRGNATAVGASSGSAGSKRRVRLVLPDPEDSDKDAIITTPAAATSDMGYDGSNRVKRPIT